MIRPKEAFSTAIVAIFLSAAVASANMRFETAARRLLE
jgi:hypothetical protein